MELAKGFVVCGCPGLPREPSIPSGLALRPRPYELGYRLYWGADLIGASLPFTAASGNELIGFYMADRRLSLLV